MLIFLPLCPVKVHSSNSPATERLPGVGIVMVKAPESATISMEPLVSNKPGPAVYLTRRLNPEQRAQYGQDLQRARKQFERVLPDIPDKNRLRFILRAIDNVQKDIAQA